jgi:hypothetical protein
MPETARLTNTNAGLRSTWQYRSPNLAVLSALALGLGWFSPCSMFLIGSVGSPAHAQPADSTKLQLRAKIKSAAEELNGIASAAPDMIRAMFAGNTASATLLALDEKSIVAQAKLESAILAASELARLGELAKKTRDPVKEDIETLKSVLALPLVGGDAAVRLAPKSQQDAVINNAEGAKRAVGALLAAIRKLP